MKVNKTILITAALTLLVAYTFAKTRAGNDLLDVTPQYFR